MAKYNTFIVGELDNTALDNIDSVCSLANDRQLVILLLNIDYTTVNKSALEKLITISIPNVIFIAGLKDIRFAATNKTNVNVLISDWLIRQKTYKEVITSNDVNYIIINDIIPSNFETILQPISSEWHKHYKGKFGYAITINNEQQAFYGYSVSLKLNTGHFQRFNGKGIDAIISI